MEETDLQGHLLSLLRHLENYLGRYQCKAVLKNEILQAKSNALQRGENISKKHVAGNCDNK
jgi:hypothetical protein